MDLNLAMDWVSHIVLAAQGFKNNPSTGGPAKIGEDFRQQKGGPLNSP